MSVVKRASLIVALAVQAGCGAHQGYTLDFPPTVLAPAAAAGIHDGRSRFRQIYCAIEADHGSQFPYDRRCDQALQQLNGEGPAEQRPVDLGMPKMRFRFVIVPGIFGECVQGMARPFEDAIKPMAKLGWRVVPLNVSGRSSSAANAETIRALLKSDPLQPGETLVLIGYSKGMSDLIELLATDTSAIIPDDSAVVSIAGVVSGTPIADGSEGLYSHFWWVPIPGCRPGNGGGVASLTRRHRLNFLAEHPLPPRLRYFSLPAFTDDAHISSFLKSSHAELSRIDPRNDGNVIFSDAVLPSSTLLGYANADHWAVALPLSLQAPFRSTFFATHNDYPRVVLLEAIGRFLEEDYEKPRQ